MLRHPFFRSSIPKLLHLISKVRHLREMRFSMRKIIIRGAIVVVILLAGTGVFQWHNYQQKIEYRKEALLYFKEEDYSKTNSYLEEA